MKKSDFTAIAASLGWTKADASRAFEQCTDLASLDSELAVLQALTRFAGPELFERQRLQGAQKGQVTKHKNRIEKLHTDYSQQLQEITEVAKQQESRFVQVIGRLYAIGRPFGLQDPWIEALLECYKDSTDDDRLNDDNSVA